MPDTNMPVPVRPDDIQLPRDALTTLTACCELTDRLGAMDGRAIVDRSDRAVRVAPSVLRLLMLGLIEFAPDYTAEEMSSPYRRFRITQEGRDRLALYGKYKRRVVTVDVSEGNMNALEQTVRFLESNRHLVPEGQENGINIGTLLMGNLLRQYRAAE